ncbi:MAG: molecular chaperone TorD family protein, partial [Gammaproteobacteria bacterium]|nr:molecular chaperone TorD family protein [Gammaproteobacteria bacterium]
VTHGELMPYGSYYQTGFLMEEPLANLRTDLARLGLERQDDTAEPEDHVAAQCDVMRLILMAEGTPVVTADEFFKRHLKPWVVRFFQDLSHADNAQFYRAVGQFGSVFLELETGLIS